MFIKDMAEIMRIERPPVFARLLPNANKWADDQLRRSILATLFIAPLLVWRGKNILIDGYRRLGVYLNSSDGERANLPPLAIEYVDADSEAEALALRYQVQDSQRPDWDDDARGIAILGNETLRAEVERRCQLNQTSGKEVAESDKGDKIFRLAKYASISRDRMYKLMKIVEAENEASQRSAEQPQSEQPSAEPAEPTLPVKKLSQPRYIEQIKNKEMTVNQAYKEVKARRQSATFQKALTQPTPTPLTAAVNSVMQAEARAGLAQLKAEGVVVDLTVTSPPYPHPTTYERYGIPYEGYESWLRQMKETFAAVYDISSDGARLCVNIDEPTVQPDEDKDVPRRPTYPDLFMALTSVGWTWLDTYIWYKQQAYCNGRPMNGGPRSSRANGAWEYVIIFHKGSRKVPGGEMTILPEERDVFTVGGLWDFYPAPNPERLPTFPYPEELPYRCIQLHSAMDATVLDPFAGSGTTLAVAKKLRRNFVGIDLNADMVKYSLARLEQISSDRPDSMQVVRGTKVFPSLKKDGGGCTPKAA